MVPIIHILQNFILIVLERRNVLLFDVFFADQILLMTVDVRDTFFSSATNKKGCCIQTTLLQSLYVDLPVRNCRALLI